VGDQDNVTDNRRGKRAATILDNLHEALRARLEDWRQTERHRREHILSLEDWQGMLARLAGAETLEALLEEAVTTTAGLCGATGVAISTVKARPGERLSFIRCQGLELAEPEDLLFDVDNPLLSAARQAQAPLKVADLVGTLGPRSKTRAALRRLGCEIIMPLTHRGQVWGLLLLTGRAGGDHLTSRDLQLLAPYVIGISLALVNIILSTTHST
jgi:GAF domain-containing protein